MKNTNNSTKTLFSRYKHMIDLLWADGQRKYTANELNTFVGQYENSTGWKRYNNNPYYSTRCYQTALKQLGCITKLKRGLWQINAPIPEWFSSFHIKALTSKWALQDLEKSSFYWNSLPPAHKVNPWKNIDSMRVMTSTGCVAEVVRHEEQKPIDLYNAILQAKGIKVGSFVKVTHKVPNNDMGWINSWSRSMDIAIGKTYQVVAVHEGSNAGVSLKGVAYNFPPQSLQVMPVLYQDIERVDGSHESVMVYSDHIDFNSGLKISKKGMQTLINTWLQVQGQK